MRMMDKLLLSSAVLRSPNDGAPPPPPDEGGDDALKSALAFDPATFFTPPANEGSDEGGEGDGAAGAKEGSADGAASSQQAEPPPSHTSPEDGKKEGEEPDPMAELRKAVQGFLTTKPPEPKAEEAPQAPKPTPTETPKEPEKVEYTFAVPDELVDSLGHEEPAVRRKAVNALVNGLANKLAKDFGSAMAEMAKRVRDEAVQAALGQVDSRTQEQQVRDDFYSNNPDLKELVDNLPQMDAVVWQTAQAVANHTKQQGWSQELRDQTANLLRLQLKLPPPAKGAAPKQNGGSRTPRKPSFSAGGGGSGEPARSNGADGGNDFLSVLNAGT